MKILPTGALAFFAIAMPAFSQSDGLVPLTAGSARIDVPAFFLDFESQPLLENGVEIGTLIVLPEEGSGFSFYSIPASETPFERVSAGVSTVSPEITYKVDKAQLGVVSGYVADGDFIFYLMCKERSGDLHCFELSYATSRRDVFDPTVERLARSLR